MLKTTSDFSNILKPWGSKERGSTISEWILVVIRRRAYIKVSNLPNTHAVIRLLKKLLMFSPTVQRLRFYFSKGKNIWLLQLWSCQAHSHAVTLFHLRAYVFLHVWSLSWHFKKVVNAKLKEDRIKRKVWNKKWCSHPDKLYPHILIKRLHNGWPKNIKEKRRNSKEATCCCRANWSAAHKTVKS